VDTLNTSKADAIRKAMQLKHEGLTNKDIVIKLNALGYRNPKTLKPWSKGMLQYRLSGIKRNDEQEVKARCEAIKLRLQGVKIQQIVLKLKGAGFVNMRSNQPYGLFHVNQWVKGIAPTSLASAKLRAIELSNAGLYPSQISKQLADEGLVNTHTGKPYSKSGISNWVLGYRYG